ncbi:MAG: hypothetical protein EHM18_18525 [Acidobacteria bacterium]|nr:MAG: hypothetical protein EHM18_18525 [Acidobacteriota bacterium]
MNHIEDELKEALRRKDAPDSLLPNVMARLPVASRTTPASRKDRLAAWLRSPWFHWATAACAVCLVLIVAGLYFQVIGPETSRRIAGMPEGPGQSQLEQGQKAKQDLLLALHIASEKLNDARRAVNDIQN